MSEIISPVWNYEEGGYPHLNAAEMKFKRINVCRADVQKYSSFTAVEHFASLLSCCSPQLLRRYPGNKHCSAVKGCTIVSLQRWASSWGRETWAIFQYPSRLCCAQARALKAVLCWKAFQVLTYRCHLFSVTLKRTVFDLYSAKTICEIQSTNQHCIRKEQSETLHCLLGSSCL